MRGALFVLHFQISDKGTFSMQFAVSSGGNGTKRSLGSRAEHRRSVGECPRVFQGRDIIIMRGSIIGDCAVPPAICHRSHPDVKGPSPSGKDHYNLVATT